MHISIPTEESISIINGTKISPFVAQCQIKVCYVGENRNRTVISKEVATKMGEYLPGSPIVGKFDEDTKDFDAHSVELRENKGELQLIDITKPYGFIAPDAKVWFQNFIDEGDQVHEYLMTEGYIWNGIYPESDKIVNGQGNNQSMEIEIKDGEWSEDFNNHGEFFIINEAMIKKLCILGENVEPCFEGAQIKKHFSLEEQFNNCSAKLQNIYNYLAQELNKGGNERVKLNTNSNEDKDNKDLLKDQENSDYEKKNKKPDEEEDNENEDKKTEEEDKDKDNENKDKSASEDKNQDEKEGKTKKDSDEDEEKKKKKFENQDEAGQEIKNKKNKEIDTKDNFSQEELIQQMSLIKDELKELRTYKAQKEKEEKIKYVEDFSMLSKKDKEEILENVDSYSLSELNAQLALKYLAVSQERLNNNHHNENNNSNYALNIHNYENKNGNESPAWVQAVIDTRNKMNH